MDVSFRSNLLKVFAQNVSFEMVYKEHGPFIIIYIFWKFRGKLGVENLYSFEDKDFV